MHVYLLILSAVAGVTLGFGLLFLFIGLRRKDDKRLSLTFSLFALSYAAAVLTAVNNYGATSLAEWVSSSHWDGVFVPLVFISLIWYVALYTGVRSRLFLGLLTAVFISLGIAQITRPNLIHAQILELAFFTLPWGEQLAYAEVTDSLWSLVFLLAQLTTIGFLLFACLRQLRRGEHGPAMALGAGVSWFIATMGLAGATP